MTKIATALIIAGSLCFIGAVGWWYAFYEQFLGSEVKKASECFYFNTNFCVLTDMASFIGDIPPYRPWAFWGSVSIIGLGVIVLALAPVRRDRR